MTSLPESMWLGSVPPRNPAHADPEWYQRDLDDAIEDPDAPDPPDRFPTERHRRVPGFDYGDDT